MRVKRVVGDHADSAMGGTTMVRMVRQQLLLSVLMASMALVAAVPGYSQKNLNNPDKIGHRTVAHRSIISPEKEIAIGSSV